MTSASPATATPSLGQRVALGAALMVLARVVVRLISVVSTLLLVRLLVPEDFGLIGLAGAAIVIVESLTSTNFAMAVIRRTDADARLYDTAWTLNLLRCLLLGGLIAATADWQATLLGDARIGPVLLVISLTIAVEGFSSVGLFRVQRDLRFAEIFRYQLMNKLVAFMITIGLAYAWQSYWCLVLGNLAAKLVTVPYSYLLAPHRPRLSLQAWRELVQFSKWMLATNICLVVDTQIPNLLLGRFGGLQALGQFQVAYQIAAMPVTEIAVPVRGPIYAGYAQVHTDRGLLGRHYLAGFGFLLCLIVPPAVGIALVAPEVEVLALGPLWHGASTLIALCALYALADSMAHFTFNLFVVLDAQARQVRVFAALLLLRAPAMLAATLAAGVVGFAAALLATATVNAVVWNWQAARLIGLRPRSLLGELWRTAAAALAMTLAVLGTRLLLPEHDGSVAAELLTLVALATLGAATQVAAQALLWRMSGSPPGPEQRLLSIARQALARVLRARPTLRHRQSGSWSSP